MSLVRTLAKVAAGVMVARTVKGMVSGGRPSSGSAPGGVTRAGAGPAGGGMEDVLGQILAGGGSRRSSAPGGGGLQDMLGQVLGGGAGGPGGGARGGAMPGGSLQDMLGQILGAGAGGAAAGGGIGGVLNELSEMSRPDEGRSDTVQAGGGGDLGSILNQSLDGFGEPERPPSREEEELAGVLLRAMVQAAKADGQIDADEKKQLLGQLGDVSREEIAFVNEELARDIDIAGLARSVPRGAEQQVYMMSAMAIDLDQQAEASYLHQLAQAMNLPPQSVNAIHDRLRIPHIYR